MSIHVYYSLHYMFIMDLFLGTGVSCCWPLWAGELFLATG